MTYYREPNPVTGYSLDADNGFFQVCVPQATRNLILNPSFETGTHSNIQGTISSESMLGFYGLRSVVAGSSTRMYVTFTTEDAGTYTISNYIKKTINEEKTFILELYDSTPSARFSRQSFVINKTNEWVRISSTINNLLENTTYTIVCSSTGTDFFYADCFQAENLPYASTYVDGDLGIYLKDSQNAYYWEGLQNQSVSVRSQNTRTGGRLISLSEYGFRTTSVSGLGHVPIERNVSRSITGQNTVNSFFTGTRNISITGNIFGETFQELNRKRKDLISLFSPLASPVVDDQILMRIQLDESSDPFDLLVRYENGLEGEITNKHQQSFQISLSAIENSCLLGKYKTAVVPLLSTQNNIQAMTKNLETGEWTPYNYQTPTGGARGDIKSIFLSPNGDLYACGTMSHSVHKLKVVAPGENTVVTTSATRVGNNLSGTAKKITGTYIDNELYLAVCGTITANISGAVAFWRASTNTWTTIFTVKTEETVKDIVFYQNRLFICGDFTYLSVYKGIAEYNFATSSVVSPTINKLSFTDDGTDITSLFVHSDQKLYLAGLWTKSIIGGSDRLASYDLTTYELASVMPVLLPSSKNGPVYPYDVDQIFLDKNNSVYIVDNLGGNALNGQAFYGVGKNAASVSSGGYSETGNSDWSYNLMIMAGLSSDEQISHFANDKLNRIYFAGPLFSTDNIQQSQNVSFKNRILSRLWSRNGFMQQSPFDAYHTALSTTAEDIYDISINNNTIAVSTNMESNYLYYSNPLQINNNSEYPSEIMLQISGDCSFVGFWNWTTKQQIVLSYPLKIFSPSSVQAAQHKIVVFYDKNQYWYRTINNQFNSVIDNASNNVLLPINISATTPNALMLQPGINYVTLFYERGAADPHVQHRIFWQEQYGYM